MRLKAFLLDNGGPTIMVVEFTRKLGSICAKLKVFRVLNSGESHVLIRPYWVSKLGGYWNFLIPSLQRCSKLGILKSPTSWKNKWDCTPHTHSDFVMGQRVVAPRISLAHW
ncbi:hypothetical protein ACFX2J_003335 [Malus domestica]